MVYPVACEKEFIKLAQENPALLLEWVSSNELSPAQLTFAAEQLSNYPPSLPVLIELVKHDSPIVREGAIYGLYGLMVLIDCTLQYIKEADESPGVRACAKELYDEWHE